MDDNELMEIAHRREAADRELKDICNGNKRWRMCIPANETDSDIVFAKVIGDNLKMEREIRRMRQQIDEAIKRAREITVQAQESLDALLGDGK